MKKINLLFFVIISIFSFKIYAQNKKFTPILNPCDEDKICLPLHLCNNDLDVQNSLNLIENNENPCPSNMQVCCSLPSKMKLNKMMNTIIIENSNENLTLENTENEENSSEKITSKISKNSTISIVIKNPEISEENSSESTSESIISVVEDVKTLENYDKNCGQRNKNGIKNSKNINNININDANYGEFPWMIAVLRKELIENDNIIYKYTCGGSLIHPKVVITTYHCVSLDDITDLIVRAGEWDLLQIETDETYKEQDRYINEIIQHDKANSETIAYDIALLITIESFILNINVNTICLPPSNQNFDNNNCFSIGWLKNQQFEKDFNDKKNILKKNNVTIIPISICDENYMDLRKRKFFNINETFICGKSQNNHQNIILSSGGCPLNCPIPNDINDRYYQAGLITWGYLPPISGLPDGYINIAILREWIDSVMKLKNFDLSYYIPK